MPQDYLYHAPTITIIVSIVAMIFALIGVWIKNSDAKGFLTAFAVLTSVVAGVGWEQNIHELLTIRNGLYNQFKSKLDDSQKVVAERQAEIAKQKDEIAKKKSEIEALDQYRVAYELAVQSALATTPTTEGDRTVFQVVMFNIPANFPADVIKSSCKDREMVKNALDPLVARGEISAGNRPAWDALMNCALITSNR